jgi:hypothetical protein
MTTEQLVRPVEVAAELGLTAEDVVRMLDEIGAKPLQDWRGYPVIAAADAKRLVEKVRAEEAERERRRMAQQSAGQAHGAKVREVYEQALVEARAEQRREQAATIRARLEGDGGFVSMTFNGLPEPGPTFPLDPIFEQRAQAAAARKRDEWAAKNPPPEVD